jgi:hypothetical protein
MVTVRLTIRLLNAFNELLAWADLQAVMKGDGCLRAMAPQLFIPLKSGTITTVSIHWPDLNVQRRQPWGPEPFPVEVGTPLTVTWPDGGIVLRFPSDPEPMPQVIVGSQSISLPPSVLGVVVH